MIVTGADDCGPIGVVGQGFVDWGGGLDFLRLILDGLLGGQQTRPVVLLLPRPGPRSRARSLARSGWRALQSVRRGHWRGLAELLRRSAVETGGYFADYGTRIAIRTYEDSRNGLARVCATEGVDGLVPICGSLGGRFALPWVGYIYDFQHRHLPRHFTAAERTRRDRWFLEVLTDAPVIVANARAVLIDVEAYFPGHAHKVRVLPFAPRTRAEWLESSPLEVAARFGIASSYFIVCNQFWLHKDHDTAIRGFSAYLAASDDSERVLVCTGDMTDAREPGYAARLQRTVVALGLGDRVHFLGRIAKGDQMALVRGADALIQSTLFEGGPGGGASYDAIAVGTPVIASDIPVNLEMDCGDVRFFAAGDASALAGRLAELVALPPARPSAEALIRQTAERSVALCEALLAALHDAGNAGQRAL